MSDEKDITTLQDLLSEKMDEKKNLIASLCEAEIEVDRLRIKIETIENFADGINGLLDSVRTGQKRTGRTFRIDDDVERTPTDSRDARVEDLSTRDVRRNNSVADFYQNRAKSTRHTDHEPDNSRFNDRTITQSCTLLLREAQGPLHVNELYRRLIAGGMKFKGNNPTISVAVSLSRNKRFCKVDPGTFDLVIREARRAS